VNEQTRRAQHSLRNRHHLTTKPLQSTTQQKQRRTMDISTKQVNPFSTWRLHVAWMHIRRVCTRAAPKENPNPNSHDHCCTEQVEKSYIRVRILMCATRQKPRRTRVYPQSTGSPSQNALPAPLENKDSITLQPIINTDEKFY